MGPDHDERHATEKGGVGQDRQALARGAKVHLAGLLVRIAHPVLLVFVTRAYGAERWGAYAFSLSAAWIALRLLVLGDDKALLWWIPRARAEFGYARGADAVVTRVARRSFTIALMLSAAAFASGQSELALFIAGAAPMAPTEACVTASAGSGTLVPTVLVRDVVTPFSFLACALALSPFQHGLGWAFLISNGLAFAVALGLARRDVRDGQGAIDGEFDRYARAIGAAELIGTLMKRSDKLLLGVFANLALVGVYDIVKQFANTLWGLRAGFEPIVTSVVSEGARSRARIRSAFHRAARTVALYQVPVAFAFIVFAEPLLALFGDGFGAGASAVRIFAFALCIAGPLGMAEAALRGLGQSAWVLRVALLALCAELCMLAAFGFGGEMHASTVAASVGAAYVLQAVLHRNRLRRVLEGGALRPSTRAHALHV